MTKQLIILTALLLFFVLSCTLPHDNPYDVNNPNHVTCDAPGYISYTQMSTTSVQLNWDYVYNATSYTIQYQPYYSSSSVWVTINSTTNSVLLTGLLSQSSYLVQVQANCLSNGFSGASQYSQEYSFYTY